MLRSSIEKKIRALEARLTDSHRRLSPDEKSHIRDQVRQSSNVMKLSKVRRQRFADQLDMTIRAVDAAGSPAVPPEPAPAPMRPQRRKRLDAEVTQVTTDPLCWTLTAVSSESSPVPLDGPPVHLLYPPRRSPSGYQDAASFINNLGDGRRCALKLRRISEAERPQEIKLLAPRLPRAGAANPLSHAWRDVTEHPDVARAEGGYVKVYYGGEAAARLQQRMRARLPTNLRLRGHRRALMFFVSVSASNSTVHFDDTPSVLTCLCGERTVWLAPPEAKRRLGLRARPRYPRFLLYDPSACEEPDPAWKRLVLRVNQGVFIPRGWWHTVHATAGSIGMSSEVREG